MEEMIEKYLLGLLSIEDRKAFEIQIAQDKDLAREVNVQRDIMEASKLQGLKSSINNAYNQVKLGKMLKIIFITTAAAALLGLATFYIVKSLKPTIDPTEVGASLPTSEFKIDNTKDTVIETANGIILHIPAHAFGDVNYYELEVKEALNALDIMESGLSTMADSNLLATAGMFKITATKKGKELQLVNGVEVTAQVPTDEVDPAMMLFDGVENVTGNVNWVNPKKIKNYLINRSFDELNFYPRGYLAKVAQNGYDAINKKFTDSLYWSFGHLETATPVSPVQPSARNVAPNLMIKQNRVIDTSAQKPKKDDRIVAELDSTVITKQIQPTSIKALQSIAFANTYIATKEFEQRLQHLFQVCDEASLNVYVQNLDKDISYADSIVALQITASKKEIFQRFAAQKLGNTKNASPAFSKLAAHHKKKKDAYDIAAQKAREKVLSKYAKDDKDKESRDTKKYQEEAQDRANIFANELQTNLVEAYRQAGLTYPSPPVPKGMYTVPIRSTGWKNLDQYVTASTISRTSLKTTYNNKNISIVYNKLNVIVQNETSYDFVNVYLIPNKLPSYQKMNKKEAIYSESLNELFEYELVCLAKKSNGYFVYTDLLQKKNQSKKVKLRSINKNELNKVLQLMNKNTANRNVADDLEYEEQNLLYNKNLEIRKKDDIFRREIEGVIWPCNSLRIQNPQPIEYGTEFIELIE